MSADQKPEDWSILRRFLKPKESPGLNARPDERGAGGGGDAPWSGALTVELSNDSSGVEGHAAKDQPVIQQPSGLGEQSLPADSRSGRCSEPTNSENQSSPAVANSETPRVNGILRCISGFTDQQKIDMLTWVSRQLEKEVRQERSLKAPPVKESMTVQKL